MGLANDKIVMSTIQPCFNELSLREISAENVEKKLRIFVSLLTRLKAYGIRKVLYDVQLGKVMLSETQSLEDFCALVYYKPEYASLRAVVSVLLDMRHYPTDAEKHERYAKFSSVSLGANGKGEYETEELPLGLYAAYVLNTFAVGFKNDNAEESIVYKLQLVSSNAANSIEEDVYCVTSESDCNDEAFSTYLAGKHIEVPKASRKNINIQLPQHHSLQLCREHAELLIQDDYVEEILDSLPFVERWEYVHHTYSNGIIHVRIFWERGGYGLKIATSGRDLVQTKWIANYLAHRYGHM